MPDGISFRIENQRSRADDGRREDKIAASVENAEGDDDKGDGRNPKRKLCFWKVTEKRFEFVHEISRKKNIRGAHLQRPNDVLANVWATRWQQNDLFLLIITGFEWKGKQKIWVDEKKI